MLHCLPIAACSTCFTGGVVVIGLMLYVIVAACWESGVWCLVYSGTGFTTIEPDSIAGLWRRQCTALQRVARHKHR